MTKRTGNYVLYDAINTNEDIEPYHDNKTKDEIDMVMVINSVSVLLFNLVDKCG